jgi:hypothetical protein
MKHRRESKRKAIEGDLKKRVADISAKLDAHFESRKNRVYVMLATFFSTKLQANSS